MCKSVRTVVLGFSTFAIDCLSTFCFVFSVLFFYTGFFDLMSGNAIHSHIFINEMRRLLPDAVKNAITMLGVPLFIEFLWYSIIYSMFSQMLRCLETILSFKHKTTRSEGDTCKS